MIVDPRVADDRLFLGKLDARWSSLQSIPWPSSLIIG